MHPIAPKNEEETELVAFASVLFDRLNAGDGARDRDTSAAGRLPSRPRGVKMESRSEANHEREWEWAWYAQVAIPLGPKRPDRSGPTPDRPASCLLHNVAR